MGKKLKDILDQVKVTAIHGSTDIVVNELCIDSRQADSGALFIARKGTAVDSHRFIPEVVNNGVVAILCEDLPSELNPEVTYICTEDSEQSLGEIASAFYDHPSHNIILCGVTGTNGKTTIVTLLHQLFSELGYGTGLMSTVKNMVENRVLDANHTTPDAIRINALLHEMVLSGCTYCFMEVSSHAIHQKRIAGLTFAGGIFTNITHDHLDYHGDFKDYLKAKKAFFDMLPKDAFALINADDKNAKVMLQNTSARKVTYGLRSACDYKGRVMENLLDGLLISINRYEVWTKLIGDFNAYNMLAVYATAIELKQEEDKVLTLLSSLDTAEGRFEYIRSSEGVTAIIDYAHTPDALQNVLRTINAIRTGNEELITVVGAGGDRDTTKRPLMGKIAGELSNRLILTSDNPRSEDPEKIIKQMKEGVSPVDFKKLLVVTNRKEAISTAYALAQPGDIILVAGKGHEKYQEIEGQKHPFDDKKILKDLMTQTT